MSLRRYVERAFAQKIPDEKKGALNVALKQIISDAQAGIDIPWAHPQASDIDSQHSFLGLCTCCNEDLLICVWMAEMHVWNAQAKGELWTRSWETMPLPLSQAAEATPASRPAAAPASWLAQHRAAKSSSLSAKPTLATSRKNRWRPWLTGYVLTCLLCLLCQPSAEWRVARAAVLS